MEINWTQLILYGISCGVGSCFGTVSTFVVMRYLPKFWDKLEALVKLVIKPGRIDKTIELE